MKPESRRRVINQLRAKAASSTFPAEATSLRERADKLEAKYFPHEVGQRAGPGPRFRVITDAAQRTQANRDGFTYNPAEDLRRRRVDITEARIREAARAAAATATRRRIIDDLVKKFQADDVLPTDADIEDAVDEAIRQGAGATTTATSDPIWYDLQGNPIQGTRTPWTDAIRNWSNASGIFVNGDRVATEETVTVGDDGSVMITVKMRR